MADIFLSKEARNVLKGKHIAVIGGSNMRGLYKDIVWLINDDSIIPKEVLGEKLEKRFPDFFSQRCARVKISNRLKKKFNDENRDWLFKNEGLHPGRTYAEPRIYYHEKKDITVNFRFVTRVWSNDLENFLRTYEDRHEAKLDLILMNSLLWDVNRWGPFGIDEYKKNLPRLLKTIQEVMADSGQFIWLTSQPGSKQLDSKAMETPGLEFQKRTTRYNVVEANFFTAHKVAEAGFDVIDLHYYFLLQTFRRNRDGIHWSPEANRYVTNMVLTHVCLADHKELPGRNCGDFALERVTFMSNVAKGKVKESDVDETLKNLQSLADSMIVKGAPEEESLKTLNVLQREARDIVDDGYKSGTNGPMRIKPRNPHSHNRPGPYDRSSFLSNNQMMPQVGHRFRGLDPRAPQQRHMMRGSGQRPPPHYQMNNPMNHQMNNPMNHINNPMQNQMNNQMMDGPMYEFNRRPGGESYIGGGHQNMNPMGGPMWRNNQPFEPSFNPMQMQHGNGRMDPGLFQNFDMNDIDLNNQVRQYNHQDYQYY